MILKTLRSAGAATILSTQALATTPAITTFDPPGSTKTFAVAINSAGVIAGYYEDSAKHGHAFIRAPDGTVTVFDPKGSYYTSAAAINDAGSITGYFSDGNCGHHGCLAHAYIRAADSIITPFAAHYSLEPTGITKGGIVVGSTVFYNKKVGILEGFERFAGGVVVRFALGEGIVPYGVNDRRVTTGIDLNNGQHGFIRSANGTVMDFDPAGSGETTSVSINNSGSVTGRYFDNKNVLHGFVRTADGTVTAFDPSGAAQTYPWCINNSGRIVGAYIDKRGFSHGFIRTSNGTISRFDVPGAGAINTFGSGTTPLGMNAKGEIAGYYTDSNNVQHGFVRSAP